VLCCIRRCCVGVRLHVPKSQNLRWRSEGPASSATPSAASAPSSFALSSRLSHVLFFKAVSTDATKEAPGAPSFPSPLFFSRKSRRQRVGGVGLEEERSKALGPREMDAITIDNGYQN
jgi:hypothetical protein